MAVNLGPVMWADPDELAEDLSIEADEATDSVRDASWVLWSLSGRKLHAAGQRQDLYRMPKAPFVHCEPKVILDERAPEVSLIEAYDPRLDPVGTGLEADGWYQIGRTLYISQCFGSPALRVTYDVQSNLPPSTERVAYVMATEHARARKGMKTRLPDRITQVTRSGTSWTVFDPTDIIKNGKSGIPEVDNWLSIVNPHVARKKPRLSVAGHPLLITRRWLGLATDDSVYRTTIVSGSEFKRRFTASEDLSAYTSGEMIWRKPPAPDNVLTLPVVIVDAVGGVFEVTGTAEQMELEPGTYEAQVWLNTQFMFNCIIEVQESFL